LSLIHLFAKRTYAHLMASFTGQPEQWYKKGKPFWTFIFPNYKNTSYNNLILVAKLNSFIQIIITSPSVVQHHYIAHVVQKPEKLIS